MIEPICRRIPSPELILEAAMKSFDDAIHLRMIGWREGVGEVEEIAERGPY
jgi:hypothetical protein